MKAVTMTTTVMMAVLLAAFVPRAFSQSENGESMNMMNNKSMSSQMMTRCRMTMNARLSPRDPAVLLGMKDQLKLTDQQVHQLQTLLNQARQKAQAILTDAQRQQVEKMPQQPESMVEMHNRMMGHMRKMKGMNGGMGNMQGMNGMNMCSMMMNMMMGGMGMQGGRGGMMNSPMHMKDGASAAPSGKAGSQVDLNGEAQADLDQVVKTYLAVKRSLAQDQFKDVPAKLAKVHDAAQSLANKTDAQQVRERAHTVSKQAQAQPKNLDAARKTFEGLSKAVIALTKLAPPTDQAAPALYVAYCPMAKANWLQATKQISNPYLGQSMPKCGSIEQTIKNGK